MIIRSQETSNCALSHEILQPKKVAKSPQSALKRFILYVEAIQRTTEARLGKTISFEKGKLLISLLFVNCRIVPLGRSPLIKRMLHQGLKVKNSITVVC